MKQKNKDSIFLKNYMEDVVPTVLNELSKKYEFCTCTRCRLDIMACALNTLPPKYIVTSQGEIYSKIAYLQQQFEVDIIMALVKAIDVVSKNPRHNLGMYSNE